MVASAPLRIGMGPVKAPRNPISRRQIETVISRSSAAFGLVFGVQTVHILITSASDLNPAWSIAIQVVIFGGLAAALVAAVAKRWVVAVNSFIAATWFCVMAFWPLAVADPSVIAESRPWPWYLCTVATAAAAVAWPLWAAVVALVVGPLTYGIVRLTPAGGAAGMDLAAFDVTYAVILGGAVLIIITMLRQAAASVDAAQGTAIDRYSNAVRQHATEVERVQVDSIVHDSVLTTLLSAARAESPEARALATTMANNAMGYLRDAAMSSPDDESKVSFSELADRIHAAAAIQAASIEWRPSVLRPFELSSQSAEAIYSAAVQAMVNSLQHAGSGAKVSRWLAVRGTEGGGIVVEIGDTGAGFEVHSVPRARIGLRVSILERVANAGGMVDVDSHPGEGTVITIRWPAVQPLEPGDAWDGPEPGADLEHPTPSRDEVRP